jgi:hypothetical protein
MSQYWKSCPSYWTYHTPFPWLPPCVLGIDFSDCGPDLILLWKHYTQGVYLKSDPGDLAVYNATVHGLQGYWKVNHTEQPSQSQVFQWASQAPDLYVAISAPLRNETCKRVVCPTLGWEGNPDIAGLGVRF